MRAAPVKRRARKACLMVATISPGELVERVRRDAERNVLRVRNGLKHLAGVGRPQLTQTPRETVWAAEKVELWHYPSDDAPLPHAVAVRPQPGVAQLRVRPRARQQLRRDDARPGLRRLPRGLGRARRARERQHARDLHRRLHPDDHRRGAAPDRQPRPQPLRLLLRRCAVAALARRQPRSSRCAASP